MTIQNMAFTPVGGLTDTSAYPTVPANEAAARAQVQDPSNQLRDFINNTLVPQTADKTKTALTYYVDTASGNDSNDGLAAGTGRAFKTIGKAISMIPQIVNHTVTIYVASGTYAESMGLVGYLGSGIINILGSSDLANAVNYRVDSINCSRCTVKVYIKGFEIRSSATSGEGIYSEGSSNAIYEFIQDIIAATRSGLHCVSGKSSVNNSVISNKGVAIHSETNGNVVSFIVQGAGNGIGLKADSGVIMKASTQPVATTAEATSNGGVIR